MPYQHGETSEESAKKRVATLLAPEIYLISTNGKAVKKAIANIIEYDREYGAENGDTVEKVIEDIYADVLNDLSR